MLIKIGYDITLNLSVNSAILYSLQIHPSRQVNLVTPEQFWIAPQMPAEGYIDMFGNRCGRAFAFAGPVRFYYSATIYDSGELDAYVPDAWQHAIRDLPLETLPFVLPSRYCESDSELLNFAWQTFGGTPLGWGRVQAICDFVHNHLRFDYLQARNTRTALEGFREQVGVCRDFTHLAITLCRCMNIPARYVTGYLGDIGVPPVPCPMDFSAWFEVYLGGAWHVFDARHNQRRIGRIVMARGRDASDVALTTVFGNHTLVNFTVVTEEVPLPPTFNT